MKVNLELLKNPTKEYRAKPFWALNGNLEKAELKRQIEIMKKMGFGGAFLHSRTGLQTEYMGKQWLELMNYCVDVLKENDMQAYLYDEDRWPSGTCGGYVTMDKTLQAKSMYLLKIDNEGTVPENLIGLFSVKLNQEGKVVNYSAISNINEGIKGEEIYAFYYKEMATDSFYNGYTYIDTMYKPAVDKFIELTHEKYKEIMGNRFGKEVVGIFTDEPHRGPLFSGFSRAEENREDGIPYTFKLFEEFSKRKGYKLEERLPLLWFGKESDEFCKETYDYVEVIEELFLENYAKPYHDWCVKNKLMFTGHILHEDTLSAQTTMTGSCMRFYEYMDYPGIDNLGSENYVYTVPALVSSVAKQLNKSYCLDELYGVSGWNMNLKDYKRMGDWQSIGGITLRCPHLSWYTMGGEAKRDCPASIFHQSAWYKDYSLIEDYFSRLTFLIKNSTDTVDVAIINPVESTWGLSNKNTYFNFFGVRGEIYQKIENEYASLYKTIKLNGHNADYIDEGLFEKYGKTENGLFICGSKQYKTVILNGNYNLRKTTLKAISQFVKDGGKVYLLGDMPCYLDGEKYNFEKDLQGVIKLPFNEKNILNVFEDDEVIIDKQKIICEKRILNGDKCYIFLNQQNIKENAVIKIKANQTPLQINLRNGEIYDVKYQIQDGYAVIEKTFGDFEEFVIVCSDGLPYKKTTQKNYVFYKDISKFKIQFVDDNMLVLDTPKLYIDDKFICQDFVVNVDKKVRRYFNLEERHNQMIQPWFRNKFNKNPDKKYSTVKLKYDFNIEDVPDRLSLMHEKLDGLKVELNGENIDCTVEEKSDIDICFKVLTIPNKVLKKGKNTLKLIFDFYEKTDIEGAFLLGDFGVKIGKTDTVVKQNGVLSCGDFSVQGLPYFGGTVMLYEEIENGKYKVETDGVDCALIKVNGKPMAFAPFEEEIEVVDGKITVYATMNRNNSFGVYTDNSERKNIKPQGFKALKIYKMEE